MQLPKNIQMNKAKLFLIPTTLGFDNIQELFPPIVKLVIDETNYYIVENEKSARKFIKLIAPDKKQAELHIFQLDKHKKDKGINEFIKPLLNGINMGLLSEAGLPAIADPGSLVVKAAHKYKIEVKALVGPSSLMLALMSSGLNGQNFEFHGYLPKDSSELKRKIRFIEQDSSKNNKSQLFIETPYRNQKLFEQLLKILRQDTLLCIATDISMPTEEIKTMSIKNWKKQKVNLQKRPTVFIVQSL